MKDQLKQVEIKLERIQEKHFIEESMPAEVFAKFNKRLTEERQQIVKQLNLGQIHSSNLEKYIDLALKLACELKLMWASSDFSGKEKLQQFIFPQGISLQKENKEVRTTEVIPFFAKILAFTDDTSQNKKGPNTTKSVRSNMVGDVGFEPTTPCL